MKLIDNLVKNRKKTHLDNVMNTFIKQSKSEIGMRNALGLDSQTKGGGRQSYGGKLYEHLRLRNKAVVDRQHARADLIKRQENIPYISNPHQQLDNQVKINNAKDMLRDTHSLKFDRNRVKVAIKDIREEVDRRIEVDKRNLKVGLLATVGIGAVGTGAKVYTSHKKKVAANNQ